MKLTTHVRPISYLKSHAAKIAKDITESVEPMLVTQNGEARLIVMDVSSYEQKEQTLALLKMLAMGKRDIEQGHYRDAEEIITKLDKEDNPCKQDRKHVVEGKKSSVRVEPGSRRHN